VNPFGVSIRLLNRLKWQVKLSLNSWGLYKFKDYQDNELVRTIVEKGLLQRVSLQANRELTSAELRSASTLGFIPSKESVSVLDFGGGTGNLHPIAQIIFPSKTFKWVVVETPELCSQAKKLISDAELQFVSSISEAGQNLSGEIDVAILGSSLQYTHEPLVVLKDILELSPNFIWITKTPFTDSNSPTQTFQRSRLKDNGPGKSLGRMSNREVEYPITICSSSALEELICRDYEIIFKLDEGPFELNGKEYQLKGYFCRKK
jgi:putative methyltransferase (TIGR04325 family)